MDDAKFVMKELSKREKRAVRTAIKNGAKYVNETYLDETKTWYPLEEEVRIKYETQNNIDPNATLDF